MLTLPGPVLIIDIVVYAKSGTTVAISVFNGGTETSCSPTSLNFSSRMLKSVSCGTTGDSIKFQETVTSTLSLIKVGVFSDTPPVGAAALSSGLTF